MLSWSWRVNLDERNPKCELVAKSLRSFLPLKTLSVTVAEKEEEGGDKKDRSPEEAEKKKKEEKEEKKEKFETTFHYEPAFVRLNHGHKTKTVAPRFVARLALPWALVLEKCEIREVLLDDKETDDVKVSIPKLNLGSLCVDEYSLMPEDAKLVQEGTAELLPFEDTRLWLYCQPRFRPELKLKRNGILRMAESKKTEKTDEPQTQKRGQPIVTYLLHFGSCFLAFSAKGQGCVCWIPETQTEWVEEDYTNDDIAQFLVGSPQHWACSGEGGYAYLGHEVRNFDGTDKTQKTKNTKEAAKETALETGKHPLEEGDEESGEEDRKKEKENLWTLFDFSTSPKLSYPRFLEKEEILSLCWKGANKWIVLTPTVLWQIEFQKNSTVQLSQLGDLTHLHLKLSASGTQTKCKCRAFENLVLFLADAVLYCLDAKDKERGARKLNLSAIQGGILDFGINEKTREFMVANLDLNSGNLVLRHYPIWLLF